MIRRPKDEALVTSLPCDRADVRRVRVRADDDVDLRIETVDDVDELRPVEVLAGVHVVEAARERRVLEAALVEQENDRLRALTP